MRPHPERDDRLAAERALGTLGPRAARRFDARLAAEPALRAQLAAWQQRLAGLALAAPALAEPSPAVWRAIERRLFGDAPAGAAGRATAASTSQASGSPTIPPTSSATPRPPAAGARATTAAPAREAARWWGSLALWRGWSAAATAAALLLLVAPPRPAPPPGPVAGGVPVIVILQADPKVGASLGASFVAGLSPDGTALVLRPLPGSARPADRAWQLWGLPAAPGGAPRSLGLVAADAPTTVVGADAAGALGASAAFAVSVEPPGGSPTGQPTGPVIAVGRLDGPARPAAPATSAPRI